MQRAEEYYSPRTIASVSAARAEEMLWMANVGFMGARRRALMKISSGLRVGALEEEEAAKIARVLK